MPYPTSERPGTLVVSTAERYLYLVQENGMALRYGVGIGREGFTWSGRGRIGRKKAVAGVDAAAGDDQAPARARGVPQRPAAGADQSARRARALYL